MHPSKAFADDAEAAAVRVPASASRSAAHAAVRTSTSELQRLRLARLHPDPVRPHAERQDAPLLSDRVLSALLGAAAASRPSSVHPCAHLWTEPRLAALLRRLPVMPLSTKSLQRRLDAFGLRQSFPNFKFLAELLGAEAHRELVDFVESARRRRRRLFFLTRHALEMRQGRLRHLNDAVSSRRVDDVARPLFVYTLTSSAGRSRFYWISRARTEDERLQAFVRAVFLECGQSRRIALVPIVSTGKLAQKVAFDHAALSGYLGCDMPGSDLSLFVHPLAVSPSAPILRSSALRSAVSDASF